MGNKTPRKERGSDLHTLLESTLLESESGHEIAGRDWARAIVANELHAPSSEPDPRLLEALLDALVARRDTETIAFLAALPAPRGVAKAARRALHHLRSQRLAVPAGRPPRAPAGAAASGPATTEPPSLASLIDDYGYRLVWLAQREANGLMVHRARISWRLGLVELKSGATSRKEYRQAQRDLLREGTVAPLPSHEARWLIHRAASRREAAGIALPDGYLRASRTLGRLEGPHPALALAPLPMDLLALYDLAELRNWVPEEEALRPTALRLQQIAASPLLLSPAQRHAQLQQTLDAALDGYFTAERRAACRELLLDTAHLLAALGRPEDAGRLRAAADLFAEVDAARHDVVRHFFTRVFFAPDARTGADHAPASDDAPTLIIP